MIENKTNAKLPTKCFIITGLILFTLHTHATSWEESQEVGELFKSAGIKGTFVLYDVTDQTYIGYNRTRAEKRFIPASTFKIPNTLIGLSVGAVKNVDEILPYGGHPQPFKVWEKDMGLREAIALSNVPIYQELARRIGLKRMHANVSKIEYGNNETGTVVDNFWLVGPLKISAMEQTNFLAKLAQDTLPFPQIFQKHVREIALLEQKENYTLYGKTGWGNAPNQGIGWWVGWVQKDGRIYAFTLNMDIQKPSDANKRLELGRATLKILGIL